LSSSGGGNGGISFPDSIADVRLYLSPGDDVDEHLPDIGTISDHEIGKGGDHGIKCDTVLYFVFRDSTGSDETEFEIIDVEDLMQENS